jgi:hypothetical protein
MIQTFDTDNYLYGILNSSTELKGALTGGIYKDDERPEGSEKEDIVVNTITTTQDYTPQKAVSNVNIYVPDISVKIGGQNQKKANRKRLKELSEMVVGIIRGARISGLSLWITNQTTVKEQGVDQHFVNLRVEWNIH